MVLEYFEYGLVIICVDVFFFGVVFLEIFFGREVISSNGVGQFMYFLVIIFDVFIGDDYQMVNLVVWMDFCLWNVYLCDIVYSVVSLVKICVEMDFNKCFDLKEVSFVLLKMCQVLLEWELFICYMNMYI